MKAKASTIYSFIYSIIIYIYSMILLPLYYGGDQTYYRKFYNTCFTFDSKLSSQISCYQATLGTREPGYFTIVKVVQPLLSKDNFISISNAVLVFLLIKIIFKYYKKSNTVHIFIFFILTNYYVNVLFFGAERLKFAFIFLLISILFDSKLKKSIVRILMIFTHLQMIMLLVVMLIGEFFSKNPEISANRKIRKKVFLIIFVLIAAVAVYLNLGDQLVQKSSGYAEGAAESDAGLVSFFKALIVIIFTFMSTKRFLPTLMQAPLLVASTILSSSRVIILMIFIYIAIVIYYKKKPDYFLSIVLVYFSYKTIGFIQNIISFGTGFSIQ